jgi:hypothetical protein
VLLAAKQQQQGQHLTCQHLHTVVPTLVAPNLVAARVQILQQQD